jgi:hypothetical protein
MEPSSLNDARALYPIAQMVDAHLVAQGNRGDLAAKQ